MSTSEHPGRGPAGRTGARGETGKTGETGPAGPSMTDGARRAFHALLWAIVVLFFVSFAIGAANLLFTTSQVHRVQANSEGLARANAKLAQQIRADCGFYRDLAGLPVASPPVGRPSIVVPRVISDSRETWLGHGCAGALPPPDPSFVKWARFYHLPVN